MAEETRDNMRGGDGSVTIRHVFKKDEFTSKTRLCARLILPPGAGIGVHQHDREDEVYIVARGSGVLNDGENDTEVTVGDAVLTGNGASHAIRNNGSEPLELIAVIACYE
jgi:mannose-6-phosphate isomerase-like protein (cupin superfamily)